jgi:hypothetical protein
MQTTVSPDDELCPQALDATELGMDKACLFRDAIKIFVRLQAARRLAALGGRQHVMPGIRLPRDTQGT